LPIVRIAADAIVGQYGPWRSGRSKPMTLRPPPIVDERARLVSLATLVVDHAAGRAENDWTATLPELRGRRLARLGKLATIRWARNAGIREIVTANDDGNVPMLALNERLGYRRLYEQLELARELVQREGLARECGQYLRRDPHRCGRVARRVAEASVGAA
jgi:GNAT superfamily N-acetyltransferase